MKLFSLEESGSIDCAVTTRRLKIYYGSNKNSSSYSRHPRINIAGQYLKNYGFKIGDTIELKLSQGRIEITMLAQE